MMQLTDKEYDRIYDQCESLAKLIKAIKTMTYHDYPEDCNCLQCAAVIEMRAPLLRLVGGK